jgi:hypothetical protein
MIDSRLFYNCRHQDFQDLGIFKIEVLVGVGNANHTYIPLKGESGFRGFSGFSGLGCW